MTEQMLKYIDSIVNKIATKEGNCSRTLKAFKVQFLIFDPEHTIIETISFAELERCMMLATYPDSLIKYIE